MPTYQIGQGGIPFGGGQFVETADGWHDPATGRRWDAIGNPLQQPAQPSSYVAPGGAQGANALTQNTRTAQSILDQLPDPHRVNVFSFNKLPTSVKQTVLGAYSAKGYDEGDVQEQWARMLPKATGAKRGYISPLGGGG